MAFDNVRDISSIEPLISNIGPYNEFSEEYNSETSFKALYESKILIIGAGGLGCEILKNLAMVGFKNLYIIDMDTIELSNLNRQFLFRMKDIGKSKAEVAAQFVRDRIDDRSLNIKSYFDKIQDKPIEFYQQFNLVISGLDSIEARRWINATLISLVPQGYMIPLIDGGTEGFRGQSRVIIPTVTSCFECSLDLLSAKVTYPVCTIANTPRLPEHCIEWATQIEWNDKFPGKKLDGDNLEHIEWVYQTALERANKFNIGGVTKHLTLGVVKNIIPAIASTNAIIAASCCNEAFKLITDSNPILNNYMMYTGDDSIHTYTFEHSKKLNCICSS
ncbi:ubiquitin-activating enzyme E1 C [Candida albicans P57072]|nr:ubiquitin-activating enzyme E1 C [Candida albicans P57072]KHC31972.1 ubiquitin-activating enzyme E1 C [Candida albicans P76055]